MTVQGNRGAGPVGSRACSPPRKDRPMRKSILLGVLGLLALSLVPVSGHAQMPGEKCELERLGTTKRADDDQNIIACLKTGDTTPGANISEWKAMTSSGSGGITGGCFAFATSKQPGISILRVSNSWGKGCGYKYRQLESSEFPKNEPYSPIVAAMGIDLCKAVEDAGYSCGISSFPGFDGILCGCVKK